MGVKPQDSWAEMLRRLKQYRKKNGDCNIPTNYPPDPALGRWLAMQRHKRKIKALSPDRVRLLDNAGVTWAPTDAAWEEMFRLLTQFKKQNGNCEVPTKWKENVRLADWVQRQRIWRKKDRLRKDRVQKLEKLGFSWAIYKGCKEPAAPVAKAATVEAAPAEETEVFIGERLYRLGNGTFVQYSGKGTPPPVLQRYLEKSRGEFPPYIPLPHRKVKFNLGESLGGHAAVPWTGKGNLPPKVIEYVQDQGVLPPYE